MATCRSRISAPDAPPHCRMPIAPDGSEVRVLCATPRGSMALFTLTPGMVSKAVAHRSVEEIWYFTRGSGRMWRRGRDARGDRRDRPRPVDRDTGRNPFSIPLRRRGGDRGGRRDDAALARHRRSLCCRGNLARDGLRRDDRSAPGRLRIAAALSRLYYPGVNPILTTSNHLSSRTNRSRRADSGPALARTLMPCPKTCPILV